MIFGENVKVAEVAKNLMFERKISCYVLIQQIVRTFL
jgi:hypothetical protein